VQEFDYYRPDSTDEVLGLLQRYGDEAELLAGGTSLVLLMKLQFAQPRAVISLQAIDTLRGVEHDENGVHIGPLTTHRAAETSSIVRSRLPALADTLSQVATMRIRNQATVGGSLCHADPAQDPPVTLMALGGTVTLQSEAAQRVVPLDEFFRGYFETAVNTGEICSDVFVPHVEPGASVSYLKYLPRSTDDYGMVGVATYLRLNERRDTIEEARVVLGGIAATPIRAVATEEVVKGETPSGSLFADAGEAATQNIDPSSDARGSGDYKRRMVSVFARRSLERTFEQLVSRAESEY
jgi:carbon-monoxide dehydrogenase medium subunit